MRHAYIILCHKNEEQVFRLYQRLNSDGAVFVLHVSLASDKAFFAGVTEKFRGCSNVHFSKREDGTHNEFGIVQAILNAMQLLVDGKIEYDYVHLLSGQDYPVKSCQYIDSFFEANAGKEFISFWPLYPEPGDPFFEDHPWGSHRQLFRVDRLYLKLFGKRFPVRELETGRLLDKSLWDTLRIYFYETPSYIRKGTWKDETVQLLLSRLFRKPRKRPPFALYGGKTWWSLTRACAEMILKTFREKPGYKSFFKYTLIPDEMFFQTLIMNSPFAANVVNDYYREIEWEGGDGTHPIFFTEQHFERLRDCKNLFARKFDTAVDSKILDRIDREILEVR